MQSIGLVKEWLIYNSRFLCWKIVQFLVQGVEGLNRVEKVDKLLERI